MIYHMRVIERHFGTAKYAVSEGYAIECWMIVSNYRFAGVYCHRMAGFNTIRSRRSRHACQTGSTKHTRWTVRLSSSFHGGLHFELQAKLLCVTSYDRFAILFAMLYQYHRIIPVTYKFKIFGVTLSDKMYIYVIATHVRTGF